MEIKSKWETLKRGIKSVKSALGKGIKLGWVALKALCNKDKPDNDKPDIEKAKLLIELQKNETSILFKVLASIATLCVFIFFSGKLNGNQDLSFLSVFIFIYLIGMFIILSIIYLLGTAFQLKIELNKIFNKKPLRRPNICSRLITLIVISGIIIILTSMYYTNIIDFINNIMYHIPENTKE